MTRDGRDRSGLVPYGITALQVLAALPRDEVRDAPRASGSEVSFGTQGRRSCAELLERVGNVATRPLHVLVPGTANRHVAKGLVIHSFRDASAYPRGNFVCLDDGTVLPSPELAFVQAARSLPALELVCVGTELSATYQRGMVPSDDGIPHVGGEMAFHTPPLLSMRSIEDYVERAPRMFGQAAARKTLSHVRDGAASPREAFLYLMLCLPSRWGGFNLPRAELNFQVQLRARAARMARARYVLCDLCWPEHRVAVEYDSDEFHALSRADDLDRVRALGLMGISVETVTTSQANDFVRLSGCVAALRKRMGLRNRPVTREVDARRLALYRRLRRLFDQWGPLYIVPGALSRIR